jgi:hypothetical protein
MHLFFAIRAFLSWDAVGYCASQFCAHVCCANTGVEVGTGRTMMPITNGSEGQVLTHPLSLHGSVEQIDWHS